MHMRQGILQLICRYIPDNIQAWKSVHYIMLRDVYRAIIFYCKPNVSWDRNFSEQSIKKAKI